MKKLLLLLGFISLIFSEKINAQTLIAGWDFQTAPGTAVVAPPNTPTLFNSNVGSGVLYLNNTNGASSWNQATELSGFTGSTLNAGGSTGLSTTTTTPACLAILGGAATPTANGKSMVFKVNMGAYQNLIISYATQKTSTGFNSQVWEYSTNGTTWVAIATVSTIPTSFAVQTLTSVTGLNGVSNAFVRLTVTGATNATGNNRLDNIQFNATLIPVPTITATPTTIPLFNYTLGNGPSTSNSYNLSGSVLTPSADTIKIFAPTNFEISKTAGTGFKDSLNILYSGSAFASTPIYARLKAGLAENSPNPPYSGNITHSGGGVTSPPTVALSGTVTTVPPPAITATGTLTAFSTFVGGNSTLQSYTVSGVNLTSDIVINAPAGYEIKTGMGAYATSLSLPQVSGNVATTTIDVRLKGTASGTFAGNIIHTSAGVTPNVNVAVTGTVGAACGTATNIGTVRAPIPEQKDYSGPIVTIAGRVTARFGTPKFYLQDATGGIAIYSTLNGGVAQANNITLGDSIVLTGQAYRAFGEAEIFNPTCVNKISTGTVPAPIIFDSNNPPSGINLPTFLDNNEGRLVKVLSANLSNTGSFASASNYPLTACNLQGDIEIRIDGTASTIISQPIPIVSQDITGVIGHYIPNATVSILQLFPRTIADFGNSSVACITPVASPSASCGPLGSKSIAPDSTLDVTCWNVEWLGNTTLTPSPLGPTNDAQQMINVMSVLKNVKSDLFCIEEVCDHRKFIDSVKVNLPKYKVRCQTKYFSHFFDSPENPADAKTFSQKVCFVYDSTVVTMVDTISLLPSQYGYDAPLPLPTPYPNNWASGRLPFMFIGDVKVGGITKQIHFVGLHAKSGSAVADYNRRKQDVIDLKAKLDTSYPNANIIMLGDYNDDLDTSIAAGKASSYANFVNDNVNYKQISRALSLCGVSSTAKYPDIIDHFLMSNEFGVLPASGATPSPSLSGIYYLENTINVTRPINYVANYTTTTSDHYPVNARFTFKLPSEIISVNSGNWSSPSTWSCNCVPSSSSNVTIDTAHTVTVDVASQVRSLNVKGTLNWVASIMLSLGQ